MLLLVILPIYAGASFLAFAVVRRIVRGRWDHESLLGLIIGPPLLVLGYIYMTEGQPVWVRLGSPLAAMLGGVAGYANAKWRGYTVYRLVVSVLIVLAVGISGYFWLTMK